MKPASNEKGDGEMRGIDRAFLWALITPTNRPRRDVRTGYKGLFAESKKDSETFHVSYVLMFCMYVH